MKRNYTIYTLSSDGTRSSRVFAARDWDDAWLEAVATRASDDRTHIPAWYYHIRPVNGQPVVVSEGHIEDPEYLGAAVVSPPITAHSWLDAKEAFGYQLTPTQVQVRDRNAQHILAIVGETA